MQRCRCSDVVSGEFDQQTVCMVQLLSETLSSQAVGGLVSYYFFCWRWKPRFPTQNEGVRRGTRLRSISKFEIDLFLECWGHFGYVLVYKRIAGQCLFLFFPPYKKPLHCNSVWNLFFGNWFRARSNWFTKLSNRRPREEERQWWEITKFYFYFYFTFFYLK